ncbi:unnamed protein product [Penicillium salamii]|nr:unnamed protein product [Penicillium salamii]CAG8376428.1 unnamed protein product [Penicillium salamii]
MANPLVINVTGTSSVSHAPERCTLKFCIKTNGSQQEKVAENVTKAANVLQYWFKQFHTPEASALTEQPVTRFSTSNITAWKKSRDDRDQPVENPHHAKINFTAIFQDFAAMGKVVSSLLAYPDVEIDSMNWSLTDETSKRLSSDARKGALRHAIQQADDLSEVLGRDVVAVEVSDTEYHAAPVAMRYMSTARGGFHDDSPPLDLTPQEIDVKSSLQVKFEAKSL